MPDQSEYLPANNARDKRVIPMHAPVLGIDANYAVVLHNLAYENYAIAREHTREAYALGDLGGMEYFDALGEDYLNEALAYTDFIEQTIRLRAN